MTKEKTSGIYFKVTNEERALIEQKMALAGVHNMSAFIRKMSIDGYVVNLEIPELAGREKLLRYISNNVNQIAHRRLLRWADFPSIFNCSGSAAPAQIDTDLLY